MLQTKILPFRHTQVVVGHIQKNLTSILFISFEGLYRAIEKADAADDFGPSFLLG